jgi:hypothetical protein
MNLADFLRETEERLMVFTFITQSETDTQPISLSQDLRGFNNTPAVDHTKWYLYFPIIKTISNISQTVPLSIPPSPGAVKITCVRHAKAKLSNRQPARRLTNLRPTVMIPQSRSLVAMDYSIPSLIAAGRTKLFSCSEPSRQKRSPSYSALLLDELSRQQSLLLALNLVTN